MDGRVAAAVARVSFLVEHGCRTPVVIVLSGSPAETAAVAGWWVRANRQRFARVARVDLCRYVQRRGPFWLGVDVSAAVCAVARALGARGRLPAGLREQSQLLGVTAGRRRCLVWVDGADQAAEVRPFAVVGGVVLVTSRRPLRGLVLDGAYFVSLRA